MLGPLGPSLRGRLLPHGGWCLSRGHWGPIRPAIVWRQVRGLFTSPSQPAFQLIRGYAKRHDEARGGGSKLRSHQAAARNVPVNQSKREEQRARERGRFWCRKRGVPLGVPIGTAAEQGSSVPATSALRWSNFSRTAGLFTLPALDLAGEMRAPEPAARDEPLPVARLVEVLQLDVVVVDVLEHREE